MKQSHLLLVNNVSLHTISVILCAYCFLLKIKFYVILLNLFYCCTECDDLRRKSFW